MCNEGPGIGLGGSRASKLMDWEEFEGVDLVEVLEHCAIS